MNSDEQAIWNAAFGSAYAYAYAQDREPFILLEGCQRYARMVAGDAVEAYREVKRLEKQAEEAFTRLP